MDHPGALRHSTDGKARPECDRLLRVGVRREDRLGSVRAAGIRKRGGRRLQPGQNLVECEPLPDHAGREHENLLHREAEQPCSLGGGGPGIELAAQTRGCVGRAGVDHDGLRFRQVEMLLGDHDGRRLHAVRREHRRTGCRNERAHEREVGGVPAQAGMHTAGEEAFRGCDAHLPSFGG